jgi:hypothetical protein
VNAIDGTGLAKKIIIELDARLKYAAANKNGGRPANQSWLYERSTNRSLHAYLHDSRTAPSDHDRAYTHKPGRA